MKGLKAHPLSDTPDQSQAVSRREILVASRSHWALWTTDRFHSRQMRLVSWTGDTPARSSHVDAVSHTRSWAAGPAVPELAQFTAQFLTRRAPVVSDVVPNISHMSLDLQFVLLEP